MRKYNRLQKKQKEAVLSWIAEGLETDEINARAAKFKPKFEVTRVQVDYYRATREADLKTMQASGKFAALSSGLALKDERVKRLQQLADLMWKDIANGFMWLDQVKALGSGPMMEVVDYEEFNTAEVAQFRATLDDIAKEMGDRKQKIDGEMKHTGELTFRVVRDDERTSDQIEGATS